MLTTRVECLFVSLTIGFQWDLPKLTSSKKIRTWNLPVLTKRSFPISAASKLNLIHRREAVKRNIKSTVQVVVCEIDRYM